MVAARKNSAPARGDIIWLDFDPQLGREQKGKRPALVLSHLYYNSRSKLALVCPITSKSKGYPFEVALGAKNKTRGVILCDQIKSIDWEARSVRTIEKISAPNTCRSYGKNSFADGLINLVAVEEQPPCKLCLICNYSISKTL
jgi:mRNA interferase MazF